MVFKDTMEYKQDSIEETITSLLSSINGLSEKEAINRLEKFGENKIKEEKKNPLLSFFSRYWGPMPWLLELAIILSYIIGHYIEVIIIFALLTVNAIIGFIHEHNSQKVLEYLKKSLAVKARILRDGNWELKDSYEIVPGDIFILGLGDIVPADAKIISGELSIDQSTLTGESNPINKTQSEIIFSSSIVIHGEAKCIAVNTGINTYFGKTVELVKIAKPRSHQEDLLLTINKYMLIIGFSALVLVSLNALFLKKDIISILTFAVIILIGSIPIALPAVFTIVQSVGAKELAEKKVLVTKLDSIEDAASMDILCIDKTGTITQNILFVMDVIPFFGKSKEEIIKIARLASLEESKDDIDLVIIEYAKKFAINYDLFKQLEFIPFDPSIKRAEALIEENMIQYKAIKGAPQVVLSLCTNLNDEIRNSVNNVLEELSLKGYRSIGVAVSENNNIKNLDFLGLIVIANPLRADSKEMINNVKELGVKPIMLTGDNLSIAKEIAHEVSIGDKIVSMTSLRALKENELDDIIESFDGFAEIYPEDKYRIVKVLQSKGHIVGMTGDGINDAPALKQAEIGIAVSNSTDVAKSSAAIVLMAEGIGVINDAIKTSRKIYQRMLSWVLNKISKVIQIIGILVVGFFWLDYFVISLLGMVLIMFANDFVTMSLATDNVKYTKNPDIWNIKKITISSFAVGISLVVQGIIAMQIGLVFFHLNDEKLSAFITLLIIFSSQFRAYIIRERRHFWSSKPCKELIISTSAAIIVFILFGIYGIIFPSLSVIQISFLLIYAALFTLSLDFLKYFVFKKTEI